jgi:hypothetical protein
MKYKPSGEPERKQIRPGALMALLEPDQLAIPAGLDFSQLQLRKQDGKLTLSYEALARFCHFNGLPMDAASEDQVGWLIAAWYFCHRVNGGPPDAVAEQLLHDAAQDDGDGFGAPRMLQ